jgi:hypothetical protein
VNKDQWVWMLDRIQCFSVKSYYNVFMSNKQFEETDHLLLKALQYYGRLTVQVFGWRLLLSRLPTRDELAKKSGVNKCTLNFIVF